jgi:DNA-binding GntR family transcriptional regulator
VAALRRRDPDAAAQAMYKHIDQIADVQPPAEQPEENFPGE